jgi:hypothetical protein
MNHALNDANARGQALCKKMGIQVFPYGNAWWLLGLGVNRVVADLAGLSVSDLNPLPTCDR